ncbi:MAG TPA: DUF222 domain-containing protein [Streptosporangiaceae bacterium]
MAEAALDFFNREDLPGLPVAVQADSLKAWSRLEAKRAAAEASLIAAFWASDGPAADGQKSMVSWLARFTRCTKAAARGQVAASFRVRDHAHVDQALAAGEISASYGRWISDVTKWFNPQDRNAVEQILVEAAAGGALIEDLEQVAAAALRRLSPGGQDHDEDRAHADRGVTLSKTFGGVGRLNGDLDVETTALAETVIGALSTKMGPEDDRTARQRRHDALAEAFRRLTASNLLPERGGAKPHVKVDIDLATLRSLPGAREAENEWVDRHMAALTRARLGGATTRDLLTDAPTCQPAGRAVAPATGRPIQPPPGLTRPSTHRPSQPEAEQHHSAHRKSTAYEPGPPHAATPVYEPTPPHDLGLPHEPGLPHEHGAPCESGPCESGPCESGPCERGEHGIGLLPGGADPGAVGGPARQPTLPGLGGGSTLVGVGPISDHLAAALACDSTMSPTVTGAVDDDALAAMTNTWLHAHGLDGIGPARDIVSGESHFGCSGALGIGDGLDGTTASATGRHDGQGLDGIAAGRRAGEGLVGATARLAGKHDGDGAVGSADHGLEGHNARTAGRYGTDVALGQTGEGAARGGDLGSRISTDAYLRLRRTMLRWAIEVLSGPGGLASYLRTGVLAGPLATPSIVLDVGTDDRTVPASLERAVRRRDRRCRFPGCDHAAELSQVHHIQPRSGGGATELWNLVTVCSFHHLIAVHTWGWLLRLNPDGTTSATGPDGRVLHEREPPGDPPLQAA